MCLSMRSSVLSRLSPRCLPFLLVFSITTGVATGLKQLQLSRLFVVFTLGILCCMLLFALFELVCDFIACVLHIAVSVITVLRLFALLVSQLFPFQVSLYFLCHAQMGTFDFRCYLFYVWLDARRCRRNSNYYVSFVTRDRTSSFPIFLPLSERLLPQTQQSDVSVLKTLLDCYSSLSAPSWLPHAC